ncbi:FAD-binding oxidoreductase, partial [Myxococcota bacterium]|nr:FAD-binding oxidoreductase [Myxococcota bacterium]
MDIIELLRREFNPRQVIVDETSLTAYATDESGEGPYYPRAAFLAQSPLEVEKLLRLASMEGFAVTPRGLGTGKSGGALPVCGGVVLAMDGMKRILEIDEDSSLAIVEPGIITQTLQQAVWEHRLFYPPDPASLDTCSLGGNVAENAGGPRAFRYGVTREYVLGMEAVTMGGKRFNLGRKSIKGVSGYDLTGLLTGSEGTLAVFTKLIMRLIPRHREPGIVLAFYADLASAARAVTALLSSSVHPMALELIDGYSLKNITGIEGFAPPAEAGGAILCEMEGLPDDDALLERLADILEGGDPLHIDVAMDPSACRRLWTARRNVSTRLKENHRYKISEDIAVPRAAIPAAVAQVQEIARRHGLHMGCYGHAGDGNLHVNFVTDDDGARKNFAMAVEELFVTTIRLGGTLSGEHG